MDKFCRNLLIFIFILSIFLLEIKHINKVVFVAGGRIADDELQDGGGDHKISSETFSSCYIILNIAEGITWSACGEVINALILTLTWYSVNTANLMQQHSRLQDLLRPPASKLTCKEAPLTEFNKKGCFSSQYQPSRKYIKEHTFTKI